MKRKDYSGKKFNMLTAVERIPNYKYNATYYLCICDCGNKTIVSGTKLSSGYTKSCGCKGSWDLERIKNRYINLKTVKEYFKNKDFVVLNDEYYSEKNIIFVDREGYKYSMLFEGFKKLKGEPGKFRQSNPFSIDNIKLWIKLNEKPFELLSNNFTNMKEELEWNCLIHGNFKRSLEGMFRKNSIGCQKCAREHVGDKCRFNIEIINEECVKLGIKYKLLSKEYVQADCNLKWLCDIHGEFEMSWSQIKSGHGCQKCAIELRSDKKDIHWKKSE